MISLFLFAPSFLWLLMIIKDAVLCEPPFLGKCSNHPVSKQALLLAN